ncbi:conserved hypothetical protein, partial [delta proteobacterium NaphS2]
MTFLICHEKEIEQLLIDLKFKGMVKTSMSSWLW